MAKQIKYLFPQGARKAMQEPEKITFIQRVISIYRIFFWIFIPFVVSLSPTIPAVLFSEWYLLFMTATIPIGVALFDYATENKL